VRVLELRPLSTATYEELHDFAFLKTDDPGVRARQEMILGWVLEALPERREQIVDEGARREARKALRRVLKARGLTLGAADEAQIDVCTVLDTLERWLDQAAVAASAAEALR
jgi:hypothetical protein